MLAKKGGSRSAEFLVEESYRCSSHQIAFLFKVVKNVSLPMC